MDESIEYLIRKAIHEHISDYAKSHGGEIVYKGFEAGIVYVILKGACKGCSASDMTIRFGVERMLRRQFPQVEKVIVELN